MELATLLPHFAGVRITRAEFLPDEVIVEARVRAAGAPCPDCHRRSRRVHSRYTRTLADRPIGERRVTVHLQVRRFHCRTAHCLRRTFAEQPQRLATRYARRSVPLEGRLRDIGLTLGGRPGARFAHRSGVTTSRMTLLRRVRALTASAIVAPKVLSG